MFLTRNTSSQRSGKEGTLSTASRNDRNGLQRPRGGGKTAPPSPGGLGQDPRALRPERLRWLAFIAKSLSLATMAASSRQLVRRSVQASGLKTSSTSTCTCRLGAMAGTSPPFSRPPARAAPANLRKDILQYCHPRTCCGDPWRRECRWRFGLVRHKGMPFMLHA